MTMTGGIRHAEKRRRPSSARFVPEHGRRRLETYFFQMDHHNLRAEGRDFKINVPP